MICHETPSIHVSCYVAGTRRDAYQCDQRQRVLILLFHARLQSRARKLGFGCRTNPDMNEARLYIATNLEQVEGTQPAAINTLHVH